MPQHDAQARSRASGSASRGAGSFRERFVALRTLRPFMVMVWKTSPSLTFFSLTLRLTRALLPVATLYVGKLIIDDVVASTAGRQTLPRAFWWLVTLEFALAALGSELQRQRSVPGNRLPNERLRP